MGAIGSKPIACNYDCPICQKSGNIPNLLGRFILIENDKMKCTGCNNLFTREELAKQLGNKVLYVERNLFN